MKEIRFWRAVFSILAVGLLLIFLFHVWNVLLPFLFGIVIAYLIHPLIDRFVSLGFRRNMVVTFFYILILGISAFLGSWFGPRLYAEANIALADLPAYGKTTNSLVQQFNADMQNFLSAYIGDRAQSFVIPFDADKILDTLFHDLPANILNVAHIGMWILIIPFVSFFALNQGTKWIDNLFEITPSEYVENLLGLLFEINATLGGYIRGLILESSCVGFLTAIGLMLLGIKGAILIGFITALLNVIPFMALIVGGAIAMLAGFFQTQSLTVLVAVFVLYGGVRIVDDFLIIPFVMGHNVRLHPILILFAILTGVELGGFLGLVFAIPIAAVIKVVLSIMVRNRHDKLVVTNEHIYS